MTSIKNIGFFGSDTEDVIIYLATILKNLEKNVSIIDLTGNFKYYFENDGQDIFTINNIDVFFESKDFEESDYDIILINFGYDEGFKADVFVADLNIMITDLQRKSVVKLKGMLEAQQELKDYIKVFRDIVDTKITKEYLDAILGASHNTTEEYIFYLNNIELECKIKLQYFNEVDLKRLPKELRKMLRDIVAMIEFEEDRKVLDKKIKQIERSKVL